MYYLSLTVEFIFRDSASDSKGLDSVTEATRGQRQWGIRRQLRDLVSSFDRVKSGDLTENEFCCI